MAIGNGDGDGDNSQEVGYGQVSKLPIELIYLILAKYLSVKSSYLLLNKWLFHLLSPILYEQPVLSSKNFFSFVETLSSSPRKKYYGSLVKHLDLSTIIQSGKNSFVSRLLRRCSLNLISFIAPQTSFGYAPLVSLRACHSLKVLDLRLVSETVNLTELFHSMKNCKNLEQLSFPRSSVECKDFEKIAWPENLSYLRLSGGITNEFLDSVKFPKTIRTLEFAHCPYLNAKSIYKVLMALGKNLKSLSIHYPMPNLDQDSMNMVLMYCRNLKFLYITVDYISSGLLSDFLDEDHSLETLWIDSSGTLGQSFKLHPDDLTIAISEYRLPRLRTVRINYRLGWDTASSDVADLVGILEDQGGSLYVVR
ncbi:hypothetical protein PACTADRAFT_42510 [Pachysolen tannophilus NRRL Y-2460]|uniref:F-box domain-containing protein n=1 Tax=Pachysolen tannophilus NRRL Y-2460 TaxID=669874 RepID=A0A1E4TU70_PACTA|nr:hypothetical protein PACTADRAFT_42510 [Pachysolen tannophilus NRRL Y-2460]